MRTPPIPTRRPPDPVEWEHALRQDTSGLAHRAFLGTSLDFPELCAPAQFEVIHDSDRWLRCWRAFDKRKVDLSWYHNVPEDWDFLFGLNEQANPHHVSDMTRVLRAGLDERYAEITALMYEYALDGREMVYFPAVVMWKMAKAFHAQPLLLEELPTGADVFLQYIRLSRLKYVGGDEDFAGYQNTNAMAMITELDCDPTYLRYTLFSKGKYRLKYEDMSDLAHRGILCMAKRFPLGMYLWAASFGQPTYQSLITGTWPEQVQSLFQMALLTGDCEEDAARQAWGHYRQTAHVVQPVTNTALPEHLM